MASLTGVPLQNSRFPAHPRSRGNNAPATASSLRLSPQCRGVSVELSPSSVSSLSGTVVTSIFKSENPRRAKHHAIAASLSSATDGGSIFEASPSSGGTGRGETQATGPSVGPSPFPSVGPSASGAEKGTSNITSEQKVTCA